ncbi:50S ribosomal protein L24 [Mycoplasmopsis opalescens]|uniref:50S ribosomal protein L24 n=1 Tax=Mycoplasmopsis opalescens TaxID=114886 RepID=UPI0004A756AD|nr:50S ribosomal protein L24 [Mycoplasmopsis opalescens]
MKFRKNDEVIVIAGDHKGRTGRIIKIDEKKNNVYIKDVNMLTKHQKPRQGQDGSIVKVEGPINASNISILVRRATKTSPATYSKIAIEKKNGKSVRILKKTKKELA